MERLLGIGCHLSHFWDCPRGFLLQMAALKASLFHIFTAKKTGPSQCRCDRDVLIQFLYSATKNK